MPDHQPITELDESRAARVVLGVMNDDVAAVNHALEEANAENRGQYLLGAMAIAVGELLLAQLTPEGARTLLERVILREQDWTGSLR